MCKFHVLVHSLLLMTSPALLVYPQNPPSYSQEKPYEGFDFTYNDVLRLISDIESERLNAYSEEEIEKISRFLAFLAQQGMPTGNSTAHDELEDDIAALFDEPGDFGDYVYASTSCDEYTILPAILHDADHAIALFCKHHKKDKEKDQEKYRKKKEHKEKKKEEKKQKKKDKKHHHHHKNIFTKVADFVKKHKKAILIGAAIVIAVAVVVVAVAAAPAAAATAAGAASAAAAATPKKPDEQNAAPPEDSSPLKDAIDEQIHSLKETIYNENTFEQGQELSLEENARMLGWLFANDTYNHLEQQIATQPALAQEVQNIGISSYLPALSIDQKFSMEYTYDQNSPLFYQVRGERALELGYFNQAVLDLGKAIEANPTNPIPYLARGVAYFGLGEYDRSIEDYKQFISHTKQPDPLSIYEFSLGFAKGAPKGAWDSGKDLFVLMGNVALHPIETSKQAIDAISTLADLVRNDEWGLVAGALSPEVYQLVMEWDALSSEQKGELAGYAVGKLGTDIFAPGALVKLVGTSAKTARELIAVSKNLKMVQKTLLLETAAEIGNGAKVAEVVRSGQTMMALGEDIGLTTREMVQLKQAGKLETTILDPAMHESFALHKKARETLKPYVKKPLPESKVRELIHETGFPTFQRPKGIPENFLVMVSDKGAGMEYVHPTNTHIRIRIMPGKPHSPFLHQRKPYAIQKMDGKAFDTHGNLVSLDSPEAHIPLDEFIYRK